MTKRNKIIFWIVTGLFSAHMLLSIAVYFFMHDMVKVTFESLGVSASLIYPLAIAKFLGLIAIWTNKSSILRELAYLGFAIDFILAATLHTMAKDGGTIAPLIALLLLIVSYYYNRKIRLSKGDSEISSE